MAYLYLVKSCNINCRKQDHSSLVGCDAVLLGVVLLGCLTLRMEALDHLKLWELYTQ